MIKTIAVKQEDGSEDIHVRVLSQEDLQREDYERGVLGELAFDPGDFKDWSL